jgi:hypothetical protein
MMPAHSRDDVVAVATRLRVAIDQAQLEYTRHRAAVSNASRPAVVAAVDSFVDSVMG